MRRALFFLLAFVLLAQFNWASAAAYCQHEGNAQSAKHWGHHEHSHPDFGQKKPGESKLVADADCNVCHASCVPPLQSHANARTAQAMSLTPSPRASPRPPSAPAGAPDRPQWPALA